MSLFGSTQSQGIVNNKYNQANFYRHYDDGEKINITSNITIRNPSWPQTSKQPSFPSFQTFSQSRTLCSPTSSVSMASSGNKTASSQGPVLYPALAAQMTNEEIIQAIRSGAMTMPGVENKGGKTNERKQKRNARAESWKADSTRSRNRNSGRGKHESHEEAEPPEIIADMRDTVAETTEAVMPY